MEQGSMGAWELSLGQGFRAAERQGRDWGGSRAWAMKIELKVGEAVFGAGEKTLGHGFRI